MFRSLTAESRRARSKNAPGFSLVEMLVYVSIVVLVTGASVSVLFSLSGMVQVYQAEQTLLRNNSSVIEQMLIDIRAADEVHTTLSVLDDPEGVLVLTLPDEQITYEIVNGIIVREDDDGILELHSSAMSVQELRFAAIDSGRSELVQVTIDSAVNVQQGTSTRSYSAAAVTRSAYD